MKKSLDNFLIMSHRRSGTHFLWETLRLNFNINKPFDRGKQGFKLHRTPDQMLIPPALSDTFENLINDYNLVYIIRDPRDTLVSAWYYWSKGAELNLDISKVLKNINFSQYIRGASINEALNKGINPNTMYAGNYLDPIQHWIDFTKWSDNVYTIRFEDLKLNPARVIENFSFEFNVCTKSDKYKLINNLVGNLPRKGIIGDWKDIFSKKDEEYLLAKANSIMQKFGYN